MAHKNEPEIPLALEGVAARLDELRTVLGTAVTPALDGVRAALIDAMAARDRGDRAGCVRHIGTAMDRLAALADGLDAHEGNLMRAVAQSFRHALLRGDTTQAKQSAAVMFEKSGALEKKTS